MSNTLSKLLEFSIILENLKNKEKDEFVDNRPCLYIEDIEQEYYKQEQKKDEPKRVITIDI